MACSIQKLKEMSHEKEPSTTKTAHTTNSTHTDQEAS
jgi:hypothetical protein